MKLFEFTGSIYWLLWQGIAEEYEVYDGSFTDYSTETYFFELPYNVKVFWGQLYQIEVIFQTDVQNHHLWLEGLAFVQYSSTSAYSARLYVNWIEIYTTM